VHLPALLAAAVLAPISVPGSVPLGHASDGSTKAMLLMGGRAQGRAPFRQTQADLGVDAPDVTQPDGTIESSGGGSQASVTLAERPSRAAYVYTMPVTCRLQAVVGTTYKSTARVTLRFADGSTKPLKLRKPPKGWHYDGHMIGTFVRTTSRIVGARAFDAHGHRAPGRAVFQGDEAC
jgi:hypothetical protein